MAVFGPKPWVNLFKKKCQFFDFLNFLFLLPRKAFFVLGYHRKHFPSLYCLKKKSWKNGRFWTKTMGYPLWKIVDVLTFWTSCFYSLEQRVFVLEYHKRYFPGLYGRKKKVGKMAFFGSKPRVNPFGKVSFFWLFELFVYIA